MKITKEELVGMGCDPDHVDDWFEIRKAKKKPLTGTALKTMVTEANKAGYTLPQAVHKCAEEGWQGFKSSYVENKKLDPWRPPQPATQKQQLRTALRNIEDTSW